MYVTESKGFPVGSVVKNPPTSAGNEGSIPELGRSSGERNGNPLQYSGLENSIDRGVGYSLQRVGHDLVTKQQKYIYFIIFYDLLTTTDLFKIVLSKGSFQQ